MDDKASFSTGQFFNLGVQSNQVFSVISVNYITMICKRILLCLSEASIAQNQEGGSILDCYLTFFCNHSITVTD